MPPRKRGHWRWRASRTPGGHGSIEVRVTLDGGSATTSTVRWAGSKRATEQAADKALTALLAKADAGRVNRGPDATLETLAETWWANRHADWSPSTAARYRRALDVNILPHLGTVRLRRLSPDRLAEWRTVHAGKAAASRAKSWLVLRQVLDHGRRLRWLDVNPAEELEPVKVPPPVIAAPDAAVVRAALAALVKRTEMWTFVLLLANTGARRGEVCGLKWSDVKGKELTIRRSVVLDGKGQAVVRPWPKSKRPRKLNLDTPVIDALAAWREQCDEIAAYSRVKVRDGFVFAAEADGREPWNPNRVTRSWARLRAKVPELEGVRLHDLRHFVATYLLDEGYTAADVAALLGHANPAITQRLYAHAIPARGVEMAATMGRLLGT